MELKEAFIQSVLEVGSLYQMRTQFKQDAEEDLITANDQVNVMISFTHTQKGTALFGFNQDFALKIASVLLEREVNSFDLTAKKAIGEFATFITSLAIGKMKVSSSVYFSDSILVTGNNILVMISRLKANQLVFQIEDGLMLLTYYIEQ
jgi:CheY-specific phosphatase CheX